MINKYKISISEWYNSVYLYNTKNLNFVMAEKNKVVDTLLNCYFNLTVSNNHYIKDLNLSSTQKNLFYSIINNIKLRFFNLDSKKIDTLLNIHCHLNKKNKISLKKWKLKQILAINSLHNTLNLETNRSLNRLFTSFPNIKHTNNYVIIFFSIFNKQKILMDRNLTKWNDLVSNNNTVYKHKFIFINLVRNILSNGTLSNGTLTKKALFRKVLNKFIYLADTNYTVKPCYNTEKTTNFTIKLKEKLYDLYKMKKISFTCKRSYLGNVYLNNYKYNILSLINLYNIINEIYGKKVKFNIINLKYVHLDNNILVNAITRKLQDRKKRLLKIIKKTLRIATLAKINVHWLVNNIPNILVENLMNRNIKNTYRHIIEVMRNKYIIGLFLEGAGRFSQRMTAARSVYKFRYKGNLKNFRTSKYYIKILKAYHCEDKSLKGYNRLIRGNYNFNLTCTKKNSYNKNGSFGISSRQNTA